ncbi:hypothetical protein GIB67_011781, partial [Kingdonia uniflora]
SMAHQHLSILLIIFLILTQTSRSEYTIGANYGTLANNLPPPTQVATFLKQQTIITKIKLFDSNPAVITAFANTNISVTVSVSNEDIPQLAKLSESTRWVNSHITPFYPQTLIDRIAVGNEILATANKNLIAHLLPAMKSLNSALKLTGLSHIQVCSPHSLGILSVSGPPSLGRFRRGYDRVIFAPLLQYHRDTKTPFMINPYPYFGFSPDTLDYALFKPNSGVFDNVTGKTYTNMFDAQLDAVYSAMERLGYGDVDIVVAETGWPSVGDADQPFVNLKNAFSYNANLVKHVNSGKGTPLMPNRTFETYIFSLFNENLKPGLTAERNFGLFQADFTPVYDIGVMRDSQATGPSPSTTPTAPSPADTPLKMWCVPKTEANGDALQANIDYVCRLGIDCSPIQDGGACFQPDTVRSHASYAMNAYYQYYGHDNSNCDFTGTGLVTNFDPSYDVCKYVS